MHPLVLKIIDKLDLQNFSNYRLIDHSWFLASFREQFEQLKIEKLTDKDKNILMNELNKYWKLLSNELYHINKLNKPLDFLAQYVVAILFQSNCLMVMNLKLDLDLYLPTWIMSWLNVSWSSLDELHDSIVCLYHYSKASKEQGKFFIDKNKFFSLFANKIKELPIDRINIRPYQKLENPSDSMTRDICNFILGCGYLALQDCAIQLQANQLEYLFKLLIEHSPRAVDPTQPLATFVMGVGYLAKGKRPVELNKNLIDKAFELILFYRDRTKDVTLPIVSFILGLGYLGLAGFPVKLNSDMVNSALNAFFTGPSNPKNLALHYSNFLLGIGYLALRKSVVEVDKNKVQKAFNIFINSVVESENPSCLTANFILSIGYFAEQGYAIPLGKNDINTALQIIIKYQGAVEEGEANIVNYFKGVSHLVSSGCSFNIPANQANVAFELVLKQVAINIKQLKCLGDFILSMGFMAINNQMIEITENMILQALQILIKSKCNKNEYFEAISDFFYGIGYYAIKHYMIKLDSEDIRQLLQFIIEMINDNKNACKKMYSAISSIFFAIGNLAEINYLIEIPAKQVKDILQIVIDYPAASENFYRDMNNIFLGIGHYAIKTQPIMLEVMQIQSILHMIDKNVLDQTKNIINLISILWAWAVYAQNDEIIKSEQIPYIADKIINYIDRFDEKDTHKFIIFLYTYKLLYSDRPLNINHKLLTQLEQRVKSLARQPNHLQIVLKEWLKRTYEIKDEAIELECLISGYHVDIAIKIGKVKIILEIDGDQHYESDGSLCKKDKVRDKFLGRFGCQIIRIRNDDVRPLLTDANPDLKIKLDQQIFESKKLLTEDIELEPISDQNSSCAFEAVVCNLIKREDKKPEIKREDKKNEELLRSKIEKLSGKILMTKAEKKLKKEYPNMIIQPYEKSAAIEMVDNVLKKYRQKIALLSESEFDHMSHQVTFGLINAIYKKSICQFFLFYFYNKGITHGIRFNNASYPQQSLTIFKIEEIIKQFVEAPMCQLSLQR